MSETRLMWIWANINSVNGGRDEQRRRSVHVGIANVRVPVICFEEGYFFLIELTLTNRLKPSRKMTGRFTGQFCAVWTVRCETMVFEKAPGYPIINISTEIRGVDRAID